LWYNAPRCRLYGRHGSLAGRLWAPSRWRPPTSLAIVGGLFVVEAMSVIIQVLYFKRTGKRVAVKADPSSL
jgi:phospho-N-acetylmuramoyl-pentapeptide-transferase